MNDLGGTARNEMVFFVVCETRATLSHWYDREKIHSEVRTKLSFETFVSLIC